MAGFRIEGNTSGNVAEVNSSGEMKVALASAKLVSDVGAGGSVTSLSYPYASPDKRLSVGIDTLLFSDEFTGTVQNTAIWKYVTSTATVGFAGTGWVVINTGNSAGSTNYTYLESYRTFSYINKASLLFETTVMLIDAALPASGLNYYIGLATPAATSGGAATTPGIPADGVFFHINSNGIEGKYASNGVTEGTVNVVTSGDLQQDVRYSLRAIFNYNKVQFFVNDILKGELNVASGLPQTGLNTAPPFMIAHYNSSAVGGTVARLKVANVGIYLLDAETSKPWSHIMAGQGLIATQIQNNGTLTGGATSLYGNTGLPTAVTLTNTTNAVGNAQGSFVTGSLGGFFRVLGTSLVNNQNNVLCAYLNPNRATNVTPVMLYVTGVKVQAAVSTVLAGGANAVLMNYAVGYGSTGVSIATTEGATTKAPRFIPIGFATFANNAAVGVTSEAAYMPFVTPLVVNPGEYFHVILRNIGSAPTSGELCFTVAIDGYYE